MGASTGEMLALNQTHSGMLQLRYLGVVHVRITTIASYFAPRYTFTPQERSRNTRMWYSVPVIKLD